MYNLDEEDQQIFVNTPIIGIVETWSEKNDITLPKCMNDFKYISSPAIRNKQKGRASGGILLCYKKVYDLVSVISTSRYWIIAKFKNIYSNDTIIITCVYIPPTPKYDNILTLLFDEVEKLNDAGEENIIMGGDFNARTSNLQIIPQNIFQNLRHTRSSCDKANDTRGKLLISLASKGILPVYFDINDQDIKCFGEEASPPFRHFFLYKIALDE